MHMCSLLKFHSSNTRNYEIVMEAEVETQLLKMVEAALL